MTLTRALSLGSALLALSLPPASIAAQQATPVEPLHIVRVSAPAYEGVGYVSETGPSSMVLLSRGRNDPVVLPYASISELALRLPNTRRQGAIRGAKWGLAGGAAVFVATYALGQVFGDVGAFRDVQWGATGALFVLSGGAAGAAYGALEPGSRWEPVPAPVRLRIVRCSAVCAWPVSCCNVTGRHGSHRAALPIGQQPSAEPSGPRRLLRPRPLPRKGCG